MNRQEWISLLDRYRETSRQHNDALNKWKDHFQEVSSRESGAGNFIASIITDNELGLNKMREELDEMSAKILSSGLFALRRKYEGESVIETMCHLLVSMFRVRKEDWNNSNQTYNEVRETVLWSVIRFMEEAVENESDESRLFSEW